MSRRKDNLLLANEAALAFVTVSAIVGMHRLFEDGSYRGPLVAMAIVAHVTVAALRRARIHLVPAALITAAAAILFITWTRFPETTRWLLPTGDTLSQVGDDVQAAWKLFGKVKPPAPVENGFLAVSAAAIWLIVYVADWAAFRVMATFEALLPATTLFVFSAALGGEGSPVAGAALFACAALLFVLLQRTYNQERTSRWASRHSSQGRSSLLGTGAVLIGMAVIAGTIAGPQFPGAENDALVAWRDITRDTPTRVVPSPMVSLRTRQVDQQDIELFTVTSTAPSYWRLTSLEQFDGEMWKSAYSTGDASGELPQAIEVAAESTTVRQTFSITQLSSVWLPAAFEPRAIETGDDDQPADFDERSSTLMVDRRMASSDNFTYDVVSELPLFTSEQLRSASTEIPEDIAATFLGMPGDLEWLTQLTEELTAGAGNAYDKARVMQDWFRTEFDYDINIGPGHSADALSAFLRGSRRGYCEQFAGAFAAMARTIGIPSRVAVGFTPGVQDSEDPNLYRVRGIHAHAWPELYLGEFGWVPFEPTPTRGPPSADGWLGVPAQQADAGDGTGSLPPDPNAGDGLGSQGDEVITDGRIPDLGTGGDGASSGGTGADESPLIPEPVQDVLKVIGLAALAYAVLVPLSLLGQRLIRRRRATSPAARVRLAWRDATERAGYAGVSLSPSLTISETAARLAVALPGSADAARGMAHTMERIEYAEQAPSADEVASAKSGSATLVAEAERQLAWPQRIGGWFDARRLRRRRPDRLVASHSPA
jgi:TgpA N-terminal domain/Transglutaminase-like superfamily